MSTKPTKPDRILKLDLFKEYINSKFMKLIHDICPDKSQSKDIVTFDQTKLYLLNLIDVPEIPKL